MDDRIKFKSGRFWRCSGGHTEPFIPFEDVLKPGPGRAARACKTCHIGMQLVTWYWDKTGSLINPPVVIRRKAQYDENGDQIVKPIERRVVSPRAVIRRLLRRLHKYEPISHYRRDKAGAVTLVISRIGEEPLPSNGQTYEKRHIILVSSPVVPMAVGITMVGVHGWLEDVKHAVKKAKLYITDIQSRECGVVPPPKVVKHRRVYRHRFPNKYLKEKVARVGYEVSRKDFRIDLVGGETHLQAYQRVAKTVAKKLGYTMTVDDVRRAAKEAYRLVDVRLTVR